MDITSLPEPVQKFISDTQQKAKEHGVEFILSDEDELDHPVAIVTESYFRISPKPQLAVATGDKHLVDWLRALVRESCHLDQWIEQTPEWIASREGGTEVIDILDLWIQHKVELTESQVEDYITRGRLIELDCEKRTLAKIGEYELPLLEMAVIQKANAYLYFYRIVAETRKWSSKGKEPHRIVNLWRKMPPKLMDDYDTVFCRKEFMESLETLIEEIEDESDESSSPDIREWKQSAGNY